MNKNNKGTIAFWLFLILLLSLYVALGAHKNLRNLQLIHKFSDTSSKEYKDTNSVYFHGHPYKNKYALQAYTDRLDNLKYYPWVSAISDSYTYSEGIVYGVLGIIGAIIYILINLLFNNVQYSLADIFLIIILGGLMACFFVLLLFNFLIKVMSGIKNSTYPQYSAAIICGLASNSVYNRVKKFFKP